MPRKVRDSSLENRSARAKFKPRGKPYYRLIGDGLHLGYRKNAGVPSKWVARRYLGKGAGYVTETIATADDVEDSNHDTVLTFFEAQDGARVKRGYTAPYRVRDAMEAYLQYLGPERSQHPRTRVERHILPSLGDKLVDSITAEDIRNWTRGLVGESDDLEIIRRRKNRANRNLSILKAALNLAFHDGKAQSDAAWRRAKPFSKVGAARTRFLTVEEAQRLLNACFKNGMECSTSPAPESPAPILGRIKDAHKWLKLICAPRRGHFQPRICAPRRGHFQIQLSPRWEHHCPPVGSRVLPCGVRGFIFLSSTNYRALRRPFCFEGQNVEEIRSGRSQNQIEGRCTPTKQEN